MITRSDLAYPGFVAVQIATIFANTYAGRVLELQSPQIMTTVDATTPIVKYPFLGAGPHMKRFRDRMDDQGVAPYMITVEDEEWYTNMRISAKALEDDAAGLYYIRARELGQAAAKFDDEMAFGLLDTGFTTVTTQDNQTFFSASHQSGASGVQSNLTSAPLSPKALQDAFGIMGSWKDDTGRPYGTSPDTLIVGPLLAMRAREIIESPIVVVRTGDGAAGSGATGSTPFKNVLVGQFNLIVDPWISGYHWFLADSKEVVKPIIKQNRTDVPLQTWDDTMDPAARRKREYNFTALMRAGYAFGPWQTAYGSNASA
ncbi:hypothetical protein EON81_19925 [bacterium]|nr:MAG: hypothetical protein EON81_19925 [bacterium]